MKQGTKMSISHFIFLFHFFSLSSLPSLRCGDSCWLHENHSSLHPYHKIIDSQEGDWLYWLHFTSLDKEKSQASVETSKLELSPNKKATMFCCNGDDAQLEKESRVQESETRRFLPQETKKTKRPNKVIKECLPFARERSTAKPRLFPLPLSLHTLPSPSVSPLHSSVHYQPPPPSLVSSPPLLLSGLPTLGEVR